MNWGSGRSEAHLSSHVLVDLDIAIGTVEGLLKEGKQDGNNDDSLERLSQDDEEDGNRKYIDSHGAGSSSLLLNWGLNDKGLSIEVRKRRGKRKLCDGSRDGRFLKIRRRSEEDEERCEMEVPLLGFGIRLGSDNWMVADQIIGNMKSHMGAVTT